MNSTPTFSTLFAPLEYGQQFPRLYLACIAGFREVFGFKTAILRLLPFVCFLVGTWAWAYLLSLRAQRSMALCVMSSVLMLGGIAWFEQSCQLKQYTFDVVLGLVPVVINDEFWTTALQEGNRRK